MINTRPGEMADESLLRLRQRVEQAFGFQPRTPKDFDALSDSIFQKTRQQVSSTTLKRFWGYRAASTALRQSTLDILARYVDCADFNAFCQLPADSTDANNVSTADEAQQVDANNNFSENANSRQKLSPPPHT